jgi:hypothetical protein
MDDDRFIEQFNEAIMVDTGAGTAALRAILAAIGGDVNLSHVRQFRQACWLLPEDGQLPSAGLPGPASRQPSVSVTDPLPPAGASAQPVDQTPVTASVIRSGLSSTR